MPMKYFKPSEFKRGDENWHEYLSQDLKDFLDDFRHYWGKPVIVSPNPDAVGRRIQYKNSEGKVNKHYYSMHNFTLWGEVKAVDVMPIDMIDAVSAIEADRLARRCCFGGVGLYPHWELNGKPMPGLHLDVRPLANSQRWGAIKIDGKQTYVSFEKAVLAMGKNG